jgi:ABC-type polar amino acid transport system ATPase subunit
VIDDVLIRVENLQKYFGNLKALDGVNAEIRKGDVVVVIGPSGSGKSTFLRCLNLLETPTGGKVYFENVDITDPKVDINKHRQKMGMVFQQFNLFPHKTVLENLNSPPPEANPKLTLDTGIMYVPSPV